MASFDKSTYTAYYGNEVTTSHRVGYVDETNRVLAMPFTTGDAGASTFSFSMTLVYAINNPETAAEGCKFAFAITEANNTDYINYNGEGDGTNYNGIGDGYIMFTENDFADNYYDISGSVDKILLPNTQYCLWLFPNYKKLQVILSLSYNSGGVHTYELSGAAGLVRIDTGSELVKAVPYIDNGTEWKLAVPYLDDGLEWKSCV